MTTAFSAGAQPAAAYLAYGTETVWGQGATDLTRLRFTTESLAGSRGRDRPNEVDGQRSVSMAVTNAVGAGGAINFAKSFKTYDDFMAALLGGAWTTNEVTDGDVFTSFTIEKKVLAAVFYQYLGMYPSAMTLNIATGAFVGGSFTFVGKKEQKATTSLDATLTAAPTGRVMSSATGIPSILVGGTAVGKWNSLNFNIQNQGAGEQRAVNDTPEAVGINPGLLMATAEGEAYFKDYWAYDRFVNESTDELAVRMQDAAGKGYTFTLLAPLVDAPAPGIQAKDRPVMQRVQFLGNPSPTTGKTIKITRDATP